MNLKITSKKAKYPKDTLFHKYKNELMNFDKIKKNYLFSHYKENIFEENKNHIINISSKNILKNQNNNKFHKPIKNSISFNHKKINLYRIVKDNKYKIKKPKFNSQISSLKYYLLYSEPGIAKKSLENIYNDLDTIQKKIDNFEEKEENKINDYEKNVKLNEHTNDNRLIINIPNYSNKKENVDNFLGLCGTYEKYNYEFSKIKNLFGTKINLFEKKNIIKNLIKNKELNNKTINNYSHSKKNFKLLFPEIEIKRIKFNRNNKNKSYDKKNFNIINNLNNNTGIIYNNLKGNKNIRNSLSKKFTLDNIII